MKMLARKSAFPCNGPKMVYWVKINRDTILKNPNAGQCVYQIAGRKLPVEEVKISKEGNWWFKRSYVDGILSAEESIKQENRPNTWSSADIEMIWRQNIGTIYSLGPQPAYFFEYEPTWVECEDCGAKFLHTYLRYFENDAYDYTWTVTGCPACSTWDCCDIQREALTQELIDAYSNR